MLDFRPWALYGSPMSQTVPGWSHRRGISSAGLFLDDTVAELYCHVSEFGGRLNRRSRAAINQMGAMFMGEERWRLRYTNLIAVRTPRSSEGSY